MGINSTLMYLTMGMHLSGSSYFSGGNSHWLSRYRFSNVIFSRSLSCFLDNPFFGLEMRNCIFSRFLGGVVRFSSIEFVNESFNGVNRVFIGPNNISINNCQFVSCSNTERGGAIEVPFQLKVVMFFDCKLSSYVNCSSKMGGALFLAVSFANITTCCFSNCFAQYAGSSIYLSNYISSKSTISHVSLMFNSVTKTLSPIYLLNSPQRVDRANISNYYTGDYSAFLYCKQLSSLEITFCNIEYVKGGNIIALIESKRMSMVYSIIRNNTFTHSLLAIDGINNNIIVTFIYSSFSGNSISTSKASDLHISVSIRVTKCYIDQPLSAMFDKRNYLVAKGLEDINNFTYFPDTMWINGFCLNDPTGASKNTRTESWVNISIFIIVSFVVVAASVLLYLKLSQDKALMNWVASEDSIEAPLSSKVDRHDFN